jgi:hypothetical protein
MLATATVAAMSLPALSVVQLDIVTPTGPAGPHASRAADAQAPRAAGPRAPRAADSPAPPQAGQAEAGIVSTAPVEPMVEEVDLGSEKVQAPSDDYAVLTRPLDVDGYATVGVTWGGDREYTEEEIGFEVRTRDGAGWSPWQEMHHDPDHTPDPDTPEADVVRAGTDAVVVGEVDQVQVRATTTTAEPPADLALAVVDPGSEEDMERQPPEHGDAGAVVEGDASQAVRLTAGTATKPKIYSRAQWGANEKLRNGSPRYGTINAGFVHHTVNANGYSRDQVPSIIRGIYAYHTQSRGWSDVGYNFLVDRFGRIWEGRYGGVARPVIGAHTLGYNEYSFAMSAIGNFETVGAPQAMVDAYKKLFAWKLSLHGVKADSGRQKVGRSYFPAISGHRDAGQTACPGRYLYSKLGEIRKGAAKLQEAPEPEPPSDPVSTSKNPRGNISGSSWPDLVSRRTSDGHLMVSRTGGQLKFKRSVTAAKGWGEKDLVAALGNVVGDSAGDVIARDQSTGKAALYPGDGRGGLGKAVRTYSRFADLDQLVGVGDFDGDGRPDMVGRVAGSQELRLYPGRRKGAFGPTRVLRAKWPYDLTVGPGDVDKDGKPDLLARSGDRLYLFRGNRTRLRAAMTLPRRWDGYDVITGLGDVTRDGRNDLLARDRSSKLTYVFPGDGKGGFTRPLGPFVAFREMRWFAVGGHLAAGAGVDVVGVKAATGVVKIFGHTGRRNLIRTFDTGIRIPGADVLLNVGDWNGDGRGDVMYRQKSTGRMMLRTGMGKNRFSSPTVAAEGWGAMKAVTAVGDVTGDRFPDLLAQDAAGNLKVYPSNGKRGFKAAQSAGSLEPEQAVSGAYDWFFTAGDLDGDGRDDVLARTRRNGVLWMLPGTSSGLGDRRLVAMGFKGHDLAG